MLRKLDLELDLHVMERQRVRIALDVQPRRLLVAHRPAQQQAGPSSSSSRYDRTRYSRSWSTATPSGSGGRIGSLSKLAALASGVIHLSYRVRGKRCRAEVTVRGYRRRRDARRPNRSLRGRHVELVPLEPEPVADLTAAAAIDRSTYEFTEVPATREAMARHVAWLLAQRDNDDAVPFAQRLRRSGGSSDARG